MDKAADRPALTDQVTFCPTPAPGGEALGTAPRPSLQAEEVGDDEVVAASRQRAPKSIVELSPERRLAALCSIRPQLAAIPLRKEILEVAEEIVSLSDGPGIEPTSLLFLVRSLIYLDRQERVP